MAMMLKKVILFFIVLSIPMMGLAAAEKTTGLTFVGKIEEIAIKNVISPTGPMEKYLSIKLDSKPKLDFQVTAAEASRYGLIDTDHASAILTPSKIKGLGWKVRLTCDKKFKITGETYIVTNVERLD